MTRLALLALFTMACSGSQPKRQPLFHTPFLSDQGPPLSPRQSPTHGRRPGKRQTPRQHLDVRKQMIAGALAQLQKNSEASGYGTGDVSALLDSMSINVGWRSTEGLKQLVSLAKKKQAYHTGPRPSPGDIVLFHNQRDANGNGVTDDWLTGCGVVVAKNSPGFEVVTRTGHRPRRIAVWPNGPHQRIVDGEKVNSFLRIPRRSDPADTVYLANQLYAGYIDIERLISD